MKRLIYRDAECMSMCIFVMYWSCEEKFNINLIELVSYVLSNSAFSLSMRQISLCHRKCFNLVLVYLLLLSKCQLIILIKIYDNNIITLFIF